MKRAFYLCILFFTSANKIHAFSSAYLGWQNFISPVLPSSSKANILACGILGNNPTRIYFQYTIQGHFILTNGSNPGNLGWGTYIDGGIGYRFLNPAYKKSGWDLGLDFSCYFSPYFLNSEIGYTETAFYYGIAVGLNTVYKINPYIGMGVRISIKYNIGTKYQSSAQESMSGLLFSIGTLLTF